MKLLKFYGSSDDLFCIEGGTRRGDPEEIPPARSVAITSSEGGLIVGAIYSPADNGCWMIGVCQVGEDAPLPAWPMRYEAKGYSVVLTIEAPDDATMLIVGGE